MISPSLERTGLAEATSPPGTPGLYERSGPFLSHSQHHDLLKAGNGSSSGRGRSDSGASATSASRTSAAFSAVSNLVSNVRHSYSSSPNIQATKAEAPNPSSPVVEPIHRFLQCEADDLRLSEVVLLLADYKRLAAALAEMQAGPAQG